MTNELEKQFFNTFNIEPIGCNDNKNCTGVLDCTQCPNAKYPQITDHILLELICIARTSSVIIFVSRDVEKLKKEVLTVLCHWVNCRVIKQKVRTLFEAE